MPKKRASTARRKAEEEDEPMNGGGENHENTAEEQDEDMNQQSGEIGDDEEMEPVETKGSPIPTSRRGMAMRSGKRKRGRSKDTSGLTPEDKAQKLAAAASSPTRASKRARKSTTKATASATTTTKKAPPPKQQQAEPTTAKAATTNGNSTPAAASSQQHSPVGVPDPRRISYAAGSKKSAARQEEEEEEEDIPPPPRMNGGASATKNTTATVTRTTQVVAETAAASAAESNNEELSVEEEAAAVQDEIDDAALPTKRNAVRIGFMTALSLFVFILQPLVVKLTNVIVPLDASLLPSKTVGNNGTIVEENVMEEVDLPAHEVEEWNARVQQRVEALQILQENYRTDSSALNEKYNYVQHGIRKAMDRIQHQEKAVQQKMEGLSDLEHLLNDMDDEQWDRIQSLASAAGIPLLETLSLQVWNVPDIDGNSCANTNEDASVEEDESTEPVLTVKTLQEKESDLVLRAQMSADNIMTGDIAKDRIRKWLEQTIDKSLHRDADSDAAKTRISELSTSLEATPAHDAVASSSGEVSVHSGEDIENAIHARFEVDRADTTGEFDHASLKNGAEIIYGGRRGTSKSLTDYLPILNRLLQSSNLRFYGFGPEAALTPSYPPNTLGHCWSFQPTSLEEQLKERELFREQRGVPNDFKRGSIGTLTISFATPVFVNSVVIEHIPQRLTDRADTAIRSFRVVGYEEDDATSEAWNLGSFEYSMQKNGNHEYLQEFEVATTSKGEDIPSLSSISLAVDSNWGHEYACLYRFRVHGEEEADEDDN
ncbi:MAG: hypothetical protein SGILL_004869 [Bacillariaceae sp.]